MQILDGVEEEATREGHPEFTNFTVTKVVELAHPLLPAAAL